MIEIPRKIQQARRIRRQSGTAELSKSIIWFIHSRLTRRLLPSNGYYHLAGIPVYERKRVDSLIPGNPYQDDPQHEYALVSALREHVTPGDHVVVVGAGSGTTCVIAAQETTELGEVTAYEGSEGRVRQSRKTLQTNGVHERCRVIHAVVGPAVRLSPGSSIDKSRDHLSPADLPKCDVLELDCEGAERNILQQLTVKPRVVIAEAHPEFGSSAEEVSELLEDLDYRTVSVVNRERVPVVTAIAKDTAM